MAISYKNIGNRFSREAIKEAIAKEKISDERAVELNELAAQVAEQFSSKSVSPFIVSGFVRLLRPLHEGSVAIFLMSRGHLFCCADVYADGLVRA